MPRSTEQILSELQTAIEREIAAVIETEYKDMIAELKQLRISDKKWTNRYVKLAEEVLRLQRVLTALADGRIAPENVRDFARDSIPRPKRRRA